MGARVFTRASSQSIVTAIGGAGFAFGPGTMAAIVRPALGNTMVVFSVGAVNTAAYRLMILATGVLRTQMNASVGTNGTTAVTTNQNYIVAVTKASGSVAPRAHIVPLDGTATTHENMGSALANSAAPATEARLGGDIGGVAQFYNGSILLAGVWDVVLSDAQIEALAFGLFPWFSPAQPRALWDLNTDSTSVKIVDISGGGANESSASLTTLSLSRYQWTPGGGVMVVA